MTNLQRSCRQLFVLHRAPWHRAALAVAGGCLLLTAARAVAADAAALPQRQMPDAGGARQSLRLDPTLSLNIAAAQATVVPSTAGAAAPAVTPTAAPAVSPAVSPAVTGAAVTGTAASASAAAADPVIKLGPGDAVSVQVYGQPEMSTTTYIADDGTINVPLAGAVAVAGMSPAQAGQQVAQALRKGQYLVDPQVTITLSQFRSQQVSVLGEVRTPGRYPIESRTGVIDLLAQAGGETEDGADIIYVLRPDRHGGVERYPINLKSLKDDRALLPMLSLKGGDSVFVPRADRYYIYGEVQAPNSYRLESGMTVIQAISRSGGVTARGSDSRIVITRETTDGKRVTIDAKPFDPIRPNDVIRVKERIF